MKARILTFLLFVLSTASCSQTAQFEQLFVGYNGPSVPKTEYFSSAASVRDSWVARVLAPSELEGVFVVVIGNTAFLTMNEHLT